MKISATIRKGISLVLLAGIFAWLVVAIFHSPEPPEPQYQGKKLTDWAKEIDQTDFFRQPAFQQHKAQSEQAIAAVRHIGTNALAVALELCTAKDSWLKRKYEEWTHQYRFPADEKRYEGANIIWALGPAAEPAIPALIRLLQSRNREIAEDVMLALPGAGANAIPPLTELLNSANKDVRIRAAIVLGDFKSQGRAAIPVLLQCLEDPNLNQIMRIRAIHALGKIKEDASGVVPVIIRHVQTETNMPMLANYLSVLRNFGTNAKPAVPVLVNILESNSEASYFPPKPAVLAALREIDPEAAKPFVAQWQANLTNDSIEIGK